MAYIKPTAALAGLLAALTLIASAAAAQTADKRVFRGGGEPPARSVERGVTVVRGQATVRPATEVAPPTRFAAGRTLWLIDEAGERLIGCELELTTLAGLRVIECASDDLPDIERD